MVRIQLETFDVGEELERLGRANAGIGALASFIGLVRDSNDGRAITEMSLEHYPGMTERALEHIVEEAQARWDLADVSVIHRVGKLWPGDPIVLVAVASAHRQAAFAACEFIMDYLKTQAPLWKRETTSDGERWVTSRVSDEQAADRWSEN